jgi:carotenoid cleavage dioxygenase-like enzyme
MADTHAPAAAALSLSPSLSTGSSNTWLEGPFAPVDQEVTVYDLTVTGSIPKDLDGRLLRVGPNPVDPENPVTYNWFTGNGMVHGVRIRDGKAEWYRNRFVLDDEVARSKGLPRLPGPEQLGGGASYVADADVPVHGRPVVHDCALTERYAIFLDGPVAYSDELLRQGYDFPFMWGFDYPTRWVLIPRDGVPGDVIAAEVERWGVFHILGAYDLPDGRVALIGAAATRDSPR